MNKIKIFENPEFGKVRTIEVGGKPYFVGKDIAEILGYENRNRDIIRHVDEEDRLLFNGETQYQNGIEFDYEVLGQRGGWLINESGLYSLILSSKLPKAREFKHWVTSEVLPSIRKTGGYVNDDEAFISTYLPFADRNTQELFRLNLSTIRQQNAQITKLRTENENMKPKAEYFDALVDRKLLTNIRDTAKELHIPQNTFVSRLIEMKYLYRDSRRALQPYSEHCKAGLFELKEYVKDNGHAGTQIFVTPKGKETFRLLLKERKENK